MTIFAVRCWSGAAIKSTSIPVCWSCVPTITASPVPARCGPAIRKAASNARYVTCANPSGPAATSLPWNNAIVRPSSGATRSRISAPGPATIPAPWRRPSNEEQARLLPLPLHPFNTDLILPIRSAKTIYVRFDLNDYSIPPEAVRRPLTLVASDTWIRILDRTQEIARHRRSYDRHQPLLDPAHQQALLQEKRKAFHSTPTGRLAQAVPESETLLDLAFARGESAGSQTAQLLKLLDLYGAPALRHAIEEALERETPRASSVAFLLRRRQQPTPSAAPKVDLSRHPETSQCEAEAENASVYILKAKFDRDPAFAQSENGAMSSFSILESERNRDATPVLRPAYSSF